MSEGNGPKEYEQVREAAKRCVKAFEEMSSELMRMMEKSSAELRDLSERIISALDEVEALRTPSEQ